MTEPLVALARGAQAIIGRRLTDHERQRFSKYLEILIKWQRSHRLVGSDDPIWVVENLFLDSLLFLKVLPISVGSILDLGSGAGIPGIPIGIVRPDARLVLVESRRRRISFLSTVVRELGLDHARVVGGRVEDLMSELGGQFDAVIMRCAGDVEALAPTAIRLLTPSGIVVASGPPRPRLGSRGEWIAVQGPGGPRGFLVYRPA